jgi:hypothetical protein
VSLGDLAPVFPDRFGDEPIVAWRGWNVRSGLLGSLNHGTDWPPWQPFTAICGKGNHQAPALKCACGIYAAREETMLQQEGYLGAAYGLVKLWGRVISHEKGFRAEHAYPELIFTTDPKAAALIRRNYGCEVVELAPRVTAISTPDPAAGDAPIEHGAMIDVGYVVNGMASFRYTGVFDPVAIGRWFGGTVAHLAPGLLADVNGTNYYHQLQLRAFRL